MKRRDAVYRKSHCFPKGQILFQLKHILFARALLMILIVAVLVGIIPESGPHLVFVTMYLEGAIPLSILIASSIVQDGHGMLPMLAVSKKSFVLIKLINVVVGLTVGLLGMLTT